MGLERSISPLLEAFFGLLNFPLSSSLLIVLPHGDGSPRFPFEKIFLQHWAFWAVVNGPDGV